MLRGIFFLVLVIPYLWILDYWILLIRLTRGVHGVEKFLDRKVQPWSHGVLNLMKLVMGTRIIEEKPAWGNAPLPEEFHVLSNHQSLLDIVMMFDLFRAHQVRFVSKKSLGKGFPGASQVLVYQKHALIDRDGNLRNTLKELKALGERNRKTGCKAVIFPEGTRSKNGELKTFHAAGLKVLCDTHPVPVVVCAMDGGWKIARIFDFLRGKDALLRMRMLEILPCPASKDELRSCLENSRAIIQSQLDAWRNPART